MERQGAVLCVPSCRRDARFLTFLLQYPGSKEEKEDVVEFYNKFGGDMKHLTQCVPFCEDEDKYRCSPGTSI